MDESAEVDTCPTDSNHVEKLEIVQEEKIVECVNDTSVPRQHSLNSESGEIMRFFNIVILIKQSVIRKSTCLIYIL